MSVRVIVGIGNREVRASMFLALDSIEALRIVGSATSAAEVVTLCRTLHPDVAIVEEGLSGWALPDLLAAIVAPAWSGTLLLLSQDDVTEVVEEYDNVHLLHGIEQIASIIESESA
ncbi:hypothetical protein ACFLQ7_00705 [Actinomycetota bacterium]|jgi:DNA-binding NarL/FixJ family response regulator